MTARPLTGAAHGQSWEHGIAALFRLQARSRPDAAAVVEGARVISYAELDAWATGIADGLVRSGVVEETLVGVGYPRSADAVAAIIGVVLAGGAYVPVNPAYPDARLQQIADEAGMRHLLCPAAERERFARLISGVPTGRALTVEEAAAAGDVPRDAGGSPADPGRFRQRDAGSRLAYVMFTSGSTGRPKGVMVEQRGVIRLVVDAGYLDLSPRTRIMYGSAPEFDASTFEIWGALLNGGCLVVADHETSVVPWRYGKALREHAITASWLTAPLFHQFAEEDPGIFAPLRLLLTGGDVVSPRHARRVLASNPGLRVLNAYGPTENTTFTTVFEVSAPDDRPLPIGRPIPGDTVDVCDESGRPVPDGEVGELWISGPGLARGYLGRPELTRERFVVTEKGRHYRTGDRVSRSPDGLLRFHGRSDDQIKVAGNLVVLSEVTTQLMGVDGIREVCTRAVPRPDGDSRLIAYVVAPSVGDEALKQSVAAVLPAYMRPERYVHLDHLPLNANGKVEWNALPSPDSAGRPPRGAERALTSEEEVLASEWAEVLAVTREEIGADADFFELGGDSIRLGRLIGRLARVHRISLPLADAHAARTLGAMADALQARKRPPAITARVAADGPGDLHPHQRALYAAWQADPDSLVYNIPVRIDISGTLVADRLRVALCAAVARHDALRMRFSLAAGGVRQQPVDGVEPEISYAEGSAETMIDGFVRPFDAQNPPHLRALLVRTGEDRHTLLLDAHHAVFDGVSLLILVDEVFERYCGTVPPEPPTTYAAAARWGHEGLAAPEGRSAEAYWSDRLARPPVSALPTDRPRGAVRATRGAVLRAELGADQVEALRRVARECRTTLYPVLLAGYVTVLSRLTGQDDVIVGSPMNGRVHPDLDGVVGMFVSTVCLRARIGTNATMADLIGQLDARAREAQQHQWLPFDQLVERLGVPRDRSRNPLFDAFFALQNIEFYEFRKQQLAISVEILNVGTTRFDLNLQAYLRPDRLVLDLEYASDLIDASSARFLLDQYVQTVTEIETGLRRAVRSRTAGKAAAYVPDFEF